MRRWVSLTPAILTAVVLAAPLAWTPLAHAEEDAAPAAVVVDDSRGQAQQANTPDDGATPLGGQAEGTESGESSLSPEPTELAPNAPTSEGPGGTNSDAATRGEPGDTSVSSLDADEADASDSEPRVRSRRSLFSGPVKSPQATGQPPKCDPHFIYALGKGGVLYELNTSSRYSQWKELPSAGLNIPESQQGEANLNGLAVGKNKAGQDVWYAYQRQAVQDLDGKWHARLHVYKSVANRQWEKVSDIDLGPKLDYSHYWTPLNSSTAVSNLPIGGAVNPVDGSFWILSYIPDDIRSCYVRQDHTACEWNQPPGAGGYYWTGNTKAQLYRVDEATGQIEAKGEAFIPNFDGGKPGSSNGDLYFDAEGNLSFVQTLVGKRPNFSTAPGQESSELAKGATKVHRISAKVLADANATTKNLQFHSSPTFTIKGLERNTGIAFSFPDGRMIISDENSSYSFNPNDVSDASDRKYGLADSRDLASCAFPHTIEVVKDLKKRKNPNDQFRLVVNRMQARSVLVDEETTTGTDTGLLEDQKLGPIAIAQGQDLEVGEELISDASGANLGDYKPKISCEDMNYPNHTISAVPRQTTGKYRVTIPTLTNQDRSPMRIRCVITNDPEPDRATVKVIKKMRPYRGSENGTNDTLQSGWNFTINPGGNPGDAELVTEDGTAPQTTQATATGGATTWQVRPGGGITLSEALTQGGETYKFVDGSCKVDGRTVTPKPRFSEAGGVVSVSGLAVKKDQTLECTFINQQPPTDGSVKFKKVDPADKALAGSVWTLTGPGLPAEGVEIKDCAPKKTSTCEGRDKDPAPGQFLVDNLTLGKYELREKSAPAGYMLDGTKVRNFTLTKTQPDFEFQEGFVNKQRPPITLPVTGGTGSLVFTLGGLFALMMAAGVAVKAVRS